jgi:hypothetical protein
MEVCVQVVGDHSQAAIPVEELEAENISEMHQLVQDFPLPRSHLRAGGNLTDAAEMRRDMRRRLLCGVFRKVLDDPAGAEVKEIEPAE